MYMNSSQHLLNLESARKKALAKISCRYCDSQYTTGNIKKHERSCKKNPANQKQCPVCAGLFSGQGTTCSYSCANTFFRSGRNNPNWKEEAYITTCFASHPKRCVVCGEDKIVAVHHMDEDRNNNTPENLVPLCPTHHQYFHSRYRDIVEPTIRQYLEQWKPANG